MVFGLNETDIVPATCDISIAADPLGDHLDSAAWIPLYIFSMIYLFLGLGIVCEAYFVHSIHELSERFQIPPDVAGATVIAAASSSPEVVAAAIGVFVSAENSVGTGTVVGSTMFNQLVIIGGSILFSGQIAIDMPGLMRDGFFYILSASLLIIFFQDGKIQGYESIVFVLCYIVYIVINWQWYRVRPCLERILPAQVSKHDMDEDDEGLDVGDVGVEMQPVKKPRAVPTLQLADLKTNPICDAEGEGGEDSGPQSDEDQVKAIAEADEAANPAVESVEVKIAEHPEGPFQGSARAADGGSSSYRRRGLTPRVFAESDAGRLTPRVRHRASSELSNPDAPLPGTPRADDGSCCTFKGVLRILAAPMTFLFRFTIPDCSGEGNPNCYPATFVISLLYIGVIVFFCVEWASKVGCLAGLSGAFMGLTVCAIGTSLPDALVSFHVARDGYGTMALSNALGSNVFDILFGLGFPWTLNYIINGNEIEVDTKEIGRTGIILFGAILLLILIVGVSYANSMALGKRSGFLFLFLYSLFLLYELLVDRGVLNF